MTLHSRHRNPSYNGTLNGNQGALELRCAESVSSGLRETTVTRNAHWKVSKCTRNVLGVVDSRWTSNRSTMTSSMGKIAEVLLLLNTTANKSREFCYIQIIKSILKHWHSSEANYHRTVPLIHASTRYHARSLLRYVSTSSA